MKCDIARRRFVFQDRGCKHFTFIASGCFKLHLKDKMESGLAMNKRPKDYESFMLTNLLLFPILKIKYFIGGFVRISDSPYFIQ